MKKTPVRLLSVTLSKTGWKQVADACFVVSIALMISPALAAGLGLIERPFALTFLSFVCGTLVTAIWSYTKGYTKGFNTASRFWRIWLHGTSKLTDDDADRTFVL